MENITRALHHLDSSVKERMERSPIPFEDFLVGLTANPHTVIRNIFQLFFDMIGTYVEEGIDEYEGDPESIRYYHYDCSGLFVNGSDYPFLADRLFANRLINLAEALRLGAQQNKIYIFQGPHGSGKSTFLNNLLRKFEEYTNTEYGASYEVVWRLDRKVLKRLAESQAGSPWENLLQKLGNPDEDANDPVGESKDTLSAADPRRSFDNHILHYLGDDCIEVPCPSHDHPVLMIPKHSRRAFFDDLFQNDKFKFKLFTEKEYEWVFKDSPCTICSSLYTALLEKLKNRQEVFKMLYVRPYMFNRRIGEGISVFSPGDKPLKQSVLTNEMLQKRIDSVLDDSNKVRYIYSRYAKTNNGVYALMDVKSNNVDRLIDLHNIISEGVHKVEDTEERVDSLFLAVMNPEDKKNIQGFQSFSDRIEYIKIPYVMDLNTEVEIYRNVFGKHIEERFLPRVLHNFARVIISSRLNLKSEAMLEWIENPEKYGLYCDQNLQLLKMEIYAGHIPPWLSEKDMKRFTAKRRRKIISESENEGVKGFSGRDSIKIFNEFYSIYSQEDRLISMSTLHNYFTKVRKDLNEAIPGGFLDSLTRMYDYTVLQQLKESLYYYNEEQITIDLQNYMFAVNFEYGSVEICTFTGERLEITEDFLENIESRLLGVRADKARRISFRKDSQKEYTSRTLPQEIMIEGKSIIETRLYQSLHERYVHNLKEKVLDPFLDNENFRRAIKDFGKEDFKTYDKRIRNDVTFLMNNFCAKFNYGKQGAKEICIYVIDNDLAKKFSTP